MAAILTAAAQVFEQRGYAAGTTERIAARAGVSIGSLYQYFPNKDAILVALAERHIEQGLSLIQRGLEEARGEAASGGIDLEGLLRRFVELMIGLHRHEPNLHRVLFEEAPLPVGLRSVLRQREQAIAEDVQRLLAQIPDVALRDPALSAYLVVQAIDTLVHGFLLHPPSGIDADAFVDDLVRMLTRYLAT